ncbi:MAG: YCF48-related protein [Cellvibrionaceae bacterium]
MASKAELKSGPSVTTSSSSSSSSSSPGTGSSSSARLLILITCALLVFIGATFIALLQDPRPDPYKEASPWETFYYPQEKNAFMRLPAISGNLNDIAVSADGNKLWAVGNGAFIIYSEDAGKTWVQQDYPGGESLSQLIQSKRHSQLLGINVDDLHFSFFSKANAAEPDKRAQLSPEELKRQQAERIRLDAQRRNALEQRQVITPRQTTNQQTTEGNTSQQKEPPQQTEDPASNNAITTAQQRPNLNAIQFVNDSLGFIVGDNGTILKTTNGGQTWQKIDTNTTRKLNAVTTDSSGQRIWAVGDSGTILYSSSNGDRWQQQNSGVNNTFASVVWTSREQAWVAGLLGAILYTNDSGVTWQRQSSNTGAWLQSLFFLEGAQQGWAVGYGVAGDGVILTTKNQGQTWDIQYQQADSPFKSIVFSADGQQGWAVLGNGDILYTTDSGNNWQVTVFPEKNSTALNNIVFSSNTKRLWTVGDAGKIITSKSNTQTWYTQSRYGWFNLVEYNKQTGNATLLGVDGLLLDTNNSGKTWVSQRQNTLNNSYSKTLFKNNQNGWSINSSAQINFTRDNGQTWQPATENAFNPLNLFSFSADGSNGWVADGDSLNVTNNAGQTWERKSINRNATITSVDFLSDGQRGWIAGDTGNIFASKDGGETWQAQNSNVSSNLQALTFIDGDNGKEHGWVVGEQGVILATTDGGTNWQQQNTDTNVLLASVNFSSDKLKGLVIGDVTTILYTDDGGQNWQQPIYTQSPAYWYWLLCLILFLLALWLLIKKPSAVTEPEETVADLLASDRPLEPGDPDPLNFNGIALGLSRFMRNPATEPPLSVAITGAWGSGKSSLMNLLYHDLKGYGFTPVWFNAWHHQKGEQLLASLYANIKDQAIPGWFKFYKLMPVGLIFRLNLLARRVKSHWFVTLVSLILTILVVQFIIQTGLSWSDLSPKKIIDSFLGEANGSFENLLVLILGGPIAILIRALQAFGISPEKLMTNRNNKEKDNKLDPSARQAFAKEFKEVSSCLDTGRMVIFIDDLDRCTKENVVDILEAMNFLSVSGDCYIVVGMDEAWVKICIENNFPDMVEKRESESAKNGNNKSFADNYLEKMINIPVPIPTLNHEDTIELLLPQKDFSQTPSLFKRFYQSCSDMVYHYRIIFSLVLCAVMVGVIVHFIPDNIFLVSEESKSVKEKLYQWDNVSINNFSVVNGQPELDIDFNDKGGSDKNKNANPVGKDNREWQLVLEGNPALLDKGITIARLGDKKDAAELVLKKIAVETEQLKRTVDIPVDQTEPDLNESAKAELISGQSDSINNDYWLPLISLLLFLIAFIIYSLKIPNRFVEDSPRFKEALSIWQPWISLQRSTPRSIKRYLNFVRYLAMRYKSPESEESYKHHLLDLIAADKKEIPNVADQMNEEDLVALSAIYAIEPDWLKDEDKLAKLREGFIQQMVEHKFQSGKDKESENRLASMIEVLTLSLHKHQSRFGSEVFSDGAVQRFLDINSTTRFNS